MRTGIKLTTLAVAIASMVEFELRFYPGVEATSELGRSKSFVPVGEEGLPIARDRSAELEAVLERPLFQPDRHPAPATAAPKLGRLEGIIVSETDKRLIFAGSSGGKPITVEEGDHVEADVVQSISEDHAALSGPSGVKVITPSFDTEGTSRAHSAQAEASERKPTSDPQSRMSRRQ